MWREVDRRPQMQASPPSSHHRQRRTLELGPPKCEATSLCWWHNTTSSNQLQCSLGDADGRNILFMQPYSSSSHHNSWGQWKYPQLHLESLRISYCGPSAVDQQPLPPVACDNHDDSRQEMGQNNHSPDQAGTGSMVWASTWGHHVGTLGRALGLLQPWG